MTVKLNNDAFIYARQLIERGNTTHDKRDDWSEHAPTAGEENAFIKKHGWDEYSKWHLGINDEKSPHTKGRYEFPYGDFTKVHRCGIVSAESRASQYDHGAIREAVGTLMQHIDEQKEN